MIIVAHRGSSGSAPENTMASFRLAVQEHADMIELDVRMTRDGELVVIHDANLRRTTDGSGSVQELTLAELQRLDAGSWYSPRFIGERIPSLHQVLEFLPSPLQLNIELKTNGHHGGGTRLTEALVRLVNETRLSERTIISSFDHRSLHRVHCLDPAMRLGALYAPLRDMGKKPSDFKRAFGAMTFGCSHSQLRRRYVDDAHDHAMLVACYTVNTRRQLEKLVKYGVDAVITNVPGQVRKWLQK